MRDRNEGLPAAPPETSTIATVVLAVLTVTLLAIIWTLSAREGGLRSSPGRARRR